MLNHYTIYQILYISSISTITIFFKKVLVVSTLSVILTLIISATIVNIQPAEASRDGFEDGKRAGVYDKQEGYDFDDDCSSSNGLYCLAYVAGYKFGYELANAID